MKTKKIFSLFLILTIAFLSACDIVEEPYLKDNSGGGEIDPGENVRKVLLEDYTGHDCVNCPEAAVEAEDLQEIYGDQLIVMAVHAGWFARPIPADPYLANYYGCPAGETWLTFFNATANPVGLVNRTQTSPGNYLVDVGEWGSRISAELEKEPDAKMTIENTFNEATSKLETKITTQFFSSQTDAYNLLVCITQDSIIDGQKNNNASIGETPLIEEYVFMHMLRTSVNGDWGEILTDGSVEEGIDYEKSYTITFEDDWVPKNCHVVAFVYNTENKTIVQAEEASVLE
jgi:hypothetical protein